MLEDAMKQQKPESDETLAARAAEGDQRAFVALYDRHFGEVYDFLLRLLLSRGEAARALLSTFVRLRRRLSSGGRRGSPRLEALAAAYRAAMENGPPATRFAGDRSEGEEPPSFAQVDPNRLTSPAQTAQAQEEAPIVWEAVSSLDRTEYALLDLRLRRRLSVPDLARVVGMGKLEAWSTISRLKNVAEDAFTSLLMLRLGSGQCARLGQLAAEVDKAILPPQLRGRVSGHVAACPTCSETKRRLVPPLRVLAALLPIEPPPGAKDTVLQNLLAYTAAQAGPGVAAAPPATAAPPRPRSMGPPPHRPRHPTASGGSAGGPAFAVILGAVAAIGVPMAALALWLGVLSDDGANGSLGAGPTSTPLGAVAAPEPCGPPPAVGEVDAGTPPVTCTPTPTNTATPTPTEAAAPSTPTPADTAPATATATATPSPTETPLPTPRHTPVGPETPVAGRTPLGVVETATPTGTPALSPGPPATPATGPSPTIGPGLSPSPPPSQQ